MSVKMKDIARAAGVSMTTVSLVLNGKGNISEQTRNRILEITRELGYTKTSTDGGVIIIGSITPEIRSCFQLAFAEYGMECHHESTMCFDELMTAFSNRTKITGVLICGGQWKSQHLETLNSMYPSIFLGSTIPKPTVDTVWVDNVSAIQMATDYLISHGHRHIGLINGPDDSFPSAEKELGFRQALFQAGSDIIGHSTRADGFSRNSGETATLELLQRAPHITALIAGELGLGLGILDALEKKGLHVPDDMSVVVFRDSPQFDTASPPLTAIGLPLMDIAREAALHMVRRLQNPNALGKRLLLKPKLVERYSVLTIESSTDQSLREKSSHNRTDDNED